MKKWIISGFVLSSIVGGNVYADSVAKCPVELKPFTKEQCEEESGKALIEANQKKQDEANKCFKEGAKKIDEDNNVNYEAIDNKATEYAKNCTQCFTDMEDNFFKECAEVNAKPLSRNVSEGAFRLLGETNQKLREVQMAQLNSSRDAAKHWKNDAYKEESHARLLAEKRDKKSKELSDIDQQSEILVAKTTYLCKNCSEVSSSSIAAALKIYKWFTNFSVFG